MNTTSHLKHNTEASFIFASLLEFFTLWKTGKKAVFNIECDKKTASFNFSCFLGHPENPHVGKQKKKKKSKSKSRAARDNERAARHQSRHGAASSPAQGGETYVTPKRTATSPLESPSFLVLLLIPTMDQLTFSYQSGTQLKILLELSEKAEEIRTPLSTHLLH